MPTPILIPPTLIRELEAHLLALLGSLSPDDWTRATVSPDRTVKDIAVRLLAGALCHLSVRRDQSQPVHDGGGGVVASGPRGAEEECSDAWVAVADHLSPRVLIDLQENTTRQYSDYLGALNPGGPAPFPTTWAGERHSQNWVEIARQYTERWRLQRLIALALGRATPIDEPHFYNPVLKMLLRAMAYTFKDVPAREGTTVRTVITGPAGGVWQIMRGGSWAFTIPDPSRAADATAIIPKDAAWQVFTKPWAPDEALRRFPEIKLEGDQRLARRVLELTAVTA